MIKFLTACFLNVIMEISGAEVSDGLYFRTIEDGTAIEIVGCDQKLVGSLIIPEKIDGKPVVAIGLDRPAYSRALTSCFIPWSVTHISEHAFFHCSHLQSINVAEENPAYCSMDGVLYDKAGTTLLRYPPARSGVFEVPDHVVAIGDMAFAGCGNLTEIILPDALVSIGNESFFLCERMEFIDLPDSLLSIGARAFWNCDALCRISIPANVTEIGGNAFSYFDFDSCMENIDVAEENQHYASIDGVLFNKELTRLIQYPRWKIGSYAIPENVVSIEDDAFKLCQNLTGISFPEALESIGRSAFELCTELKHIRIPARVNRIELDAFESCISLEAFTVDEDNTDYSSIDGVLFDKDQTKLIKCPAKKTGVYTVPEGVETIASDTFSNCSGLTEILLPTSLVSIGHMAFYECHGLTAVTIPQSVQNIGMHAFDNCSKLTDIYMSSNLVQTEDYWMGGAKVHILGDSSLYASIDGVLFDKDRKKLIRCPKDKSGTYVIPGGTVSVVERAFLLCNALTNIVFPESLNSIGTFSFCGCKRLESVYVPVNVSHIGRGAFSFCSSLKSISVDPDNQFYASADGVLFNKQLTELIQYPLGRSEEYTVPGSVVTIKEAAFSGASMRTVKFHESVDFIERSAFSDSSNLTEVILPQSIAYIEDNAFGGCNSLSNMIFTGDAPLVNHSAFERTADGFTVYFFYHNAGFSSPLWVGYPAFAITDAISCWLNYYGYPIDTELSHDPNEDGVSLLSAYALGLNPRQNLAESLPKPVIDSGRLGIRFYAGAENIQYIVETSTDLQSWTFDGVLISGQDADSYFTASVKMDVPCRFIRLRFVER